MALSREGKWTFVLALFPFGWIMFGLHNIVWVGSLCWGVCILLVLDIYWPANPVRKYFERRKRTGPKIINETTAPEEKTIPPKEPPKNEWPKVLLECISNPASGDTTHFTHYVDTILKLENTGHDAHVVQIQPIEIGDTKASFDIVEKVLHGNSCELRPAMVTQRNFPGSSPLHHHDLTKLFDDDSVNEEEGIPIFIEYENGFGPKFETEYKVKYERFFGILQFHLVGIRFRPN